MKRKKMMALLLVLFPLCIFARQTDAATQVIQRTLGKQSLPIKLKIKKSSNHAVYFQHEVKDGVLHISGSDNVALCRGFYDFIKTQHYGLSSWSGTNIQWPQMLPDTPEKKIISNFQNHYYFNVVTYGYSMPYWDWNRWEKEIDWMALHGINMPLALVAQEAISARVWSKLGLTDEEINHYFVGPAHLPWMRMGNISGIDGPLTPDWHKKQIALQHQILQRMKSLGMKPICPAFAGFVPQALKRIYPNVKITETSWGGAFHNWMLSPEEELFHTLGKMYIEEWEKEFGKNDYYLADSFNEMDIPFPPKDDPKRYELLASYGEKVYSSIKDGNKDAVWVMQGWMFGYQRHIWDYKTLQALVSRVPDDKMLLLDLAVDYNRHFWKTEVNWEFYKGFYNKPWIYSVIPNMGGKNGLTGVLEFYANGHWDALHSANKGQLAGFGMAPEGIENNEVIYELVTDAGWADKKIDLQQWLKDYSTCRYGSYPEAVKECWQGLLGSVYGTFTDHPRYCWQFRPGMVRKGTIQADETFYQAIETLAKGADAFRGNDLFAYDFAQWTAAYVGGKMELLVAKIEHAYAQHDLELAKVYEADFTRLALSTDALLSAFPTTDLKEWIRKARSYGNTSEEADIYESNARRIVTIWGPPVDDYSARIWSGLIRDYYLQRWLHYFQQKASGKPFDFAAWEADWVENKKGVSQVNTPSNVVDAAIRLVQEASHIQPLQTQNNLLGQWNTANAADQCCTFSWHINSEQLNHLKGFRILCSDKSHTVCVKSISLWADGEKSIEVSPDVEASPSCFVSLICEEPIRGNNSLEVKITLQKTATNSPSGTIEWIY